MQKLVPKPKPFHWPLKWDNALQAVLHNSVVINYRSPNVNTGDQIAGHYSGGIGNMT